MSPSNDVSAVLQTLYRHPGIRAVLCIDARGNIQKRAGQAHSLKNASGADDPTVVMPIDTSSDGPEESLYVCEYNDDFLVIVFDEATDFEHLKDDIDTTLEGYLD